MKRITFYVASLKEGKIVKLIREVDKVACNIEIDFDKNVIILSELNEDMLETCVDLVSSCYKTISKIRIENSNEEVTKTKISNVLSNESKKRVVKNEDNITNIEMLINNTFQTTFNSLDSSKTVEENINIFLDGIGLDKNAPYVFKSFLIGTNVKRINYESILLELKKGSKNVSEEDIKRELRKTFDKFLTSHTDLKAKYAKISIMTLIKSFVKMLNSK